MNLVWIFFLVSLISYYSIKINKPNQAWSFGGLVNLGLFILIIIIIGLSQGWYYAGSYFIILLLAFIISSFTLIHSFKQKIDKDKTPIPWALLGLSLITFGYWIVMIILKARINHLMNY